MTSKHSRFFRNNPFTYWQSDGPAAWEHLSLQYYSKWHLFENGRSEKKRKGEKEGTKGRGEQKEDERKSRCQSIRGQAN